MEVFLMVFFSLQKKASHKETDSDTASQMETDPNTASQTEADTDTE